MTFSLQAPVRRRPPPGGPVLTGALTTVGLDVVLVASVAAGSLVVVAQGGLALPTALGRGLHGAEILLGLATAVPLLGWRRRPLAAFVAVGFASLALAARSGMIWPPIGLAAATYLLARGRSVSTPWPPWTLGLVSAVLGAYLALGYDELTGVLHSAIALALAWYAGEAHRLRQARIVELRERAERVTREAERDRVLALVEERARIARDLHDSVAHALNVIGVRAGAARLRQDPAAALAAVATIEELSRTTMAEIDQVIGALRSSDPGDRPAVPGAEVGAGHGIEAPPGLAAIDGLVAGHRAGGHDVALTVGALGPLAGPVEHGVYRIVQEALTNAARYGAGVTRVDLTRDAGVLRLSITNRVEAGRSPEGGGHGLIGMRERVLSLGGVIDAGVVGDQFRVSARFPGAGPRS